MAGKPHKLNHPREVINTCEFCTKEFQVKWQYRKQRFCSVTCKCDWIKSIHWEEVNCLHCGEKFKRRKNYRHWRNGAQKNYCGISCWEKCKEHKDKSRMWTIKNQPMNVQKSVDKIGKTKLEKYGNSNYNNMEGYKKTMMKKYGVPYGLLLKKANGIRISKPQRELYERIKKKHKDALLEEWLPDVQRSVDIYIPSLKKVVEFYGDYWHCNPKKFHPDYYNNQVHMSAKEIWERDEYRVDNLKKKGYRVEIVWENSNKRMKSWTIGEDLL